MSYCSRVWGPVVHIHVSVNAFEPLSGLTYQTDAQGAIKNLTARHDDLSRYSTAYGWLLIIQLSVQNQDLLDVYWFLVRLHRATEHRLLTSIRDLTRLLMNINNPVSRTWPNTDFSACLCVFALSIWIYGFLCVCAWVSASFSDQMSTCLLYVPPPPPAFMKWVYWVAFCAALSPNFKLLMCDVFGALAVSEVWCLSLPLGNGCDRLFLFFFLSIGRSPR